MPYLLGCSGRRWIDGWGGGGQDNTVGNLMLVSGYWRDKELVCDMPSRSSSIVCITLSLSSTGLRQYIYQDSPTELVDQTPSCDRPIHSWEAERQNRGTSQTLSALSRLCQNKRLQNNINSCNCRIQHVTASIATRKRIINPGQNLVSFNMQASCFLESL